MSLIARDLARLEQAKRVLCSGGTAPEAVAVRSADVSDAAACTKAVERCVEEFGPPAWAISCAGIVEPGFLNELTVADARSQMDVNYFGAVNFAKACTPSMVTRGSGRLMFIASASAIIGIAGYAAYGASKFALRGFAESLCVELAPHGIAVSIAYPPDTDTPQLESELAQRSEATTRIAGWAGRLSADAAARKILSQAGWGRFALTPGWRLSLLYMWHSLISPFFRFFQRRALRAGRG